MEISFADLGLNPDYEASIGLCRRPFWLAGDREYPLIVHSDYSTLSAFASKIAEAFGRAAVSARLKFGEGDEVVAVAETVGWSLDFPEFIKTFSFNGGIHEIPREMAIPGILISPPIRAIDLEDYLPFEKVAEYRTNYADGNDRAHNIALCSSLLSEVEMGIGETFSFNGYVGPRTQDRGYRKAPTFVGDDTVDDYGGGVCQVSTTLYMAMLKAGFSIAERYCHAQPVSYVPLGFDATVSYGYLDLRMTNSGEAPCLVRVTAGEGELLVEVFSRPVPDLSIEVESRILKEMLAEVPSAPVVGADDPASQAPASGDTGTPKLRNGFLVETVRKWVRDGRVERVERLNTSMYPAEKPKSR